MERSSRESSPPNIFSSNLEQVGQPTAQLLDSIDKNIYLVNLKEKWNHSLQFLPAASSRVLQSY